MRDRHAFLKLNLALGHDVTLPERNNLIIVLNELTFGANQVGFYIAEGHYNKFKESLSLTGYYGLDVNFFGRPVHEYKG